MAYIARRIFPGICFLSGIDIKTAFKMEYEGSEVSWKCSWNRICLLRADIVRMVFNRTLAWRKLELYWLGTVSWNSDLSVNFI